MLGKEKNLRDGGTNLVPLIQVRLLVGEMAHEWIPQCLCSWWSCESIRNWMGLCWRTSSCLGVGSWSTCSRLVQVLEGLEEMWDLSWHVDGWFNIVVLPVLYGLILLTDGQLRRVRYSFFWSVERRNKMQNSQEMIHEKQACETKSLG